MNSTIWVSAQEASNILGVSLKTLENWKDVGYLKYGTHWRIFDSLYRESDEGKVFYHILWCNEEINYWRSHDSAIGRFAA